MTMASPSPAAYEVTATSTRSSCTNVSGTGIDHRHYTQNPSVLQPDMQMSASAQYQVRSELITPQNDVTVPLNVNSDFEMGDTMMVPPTNITADDLLDVVLQDIDIGMEHSVGQIQTTECSDNAHFKQPDWEINNNNCNIAFVTNTNAPRGNLTAKKVDRNMKNAVLAKRNREKKKAYMLTMEHKLQAMEKDYEHINSEKMHLEELNKSLSEQKNIAENNARALQAENLFLKSILASSSSAVAGLVQHLHKLNYKYDTISVQQNSQYHKPDIQCVCLHIKKDNVSARVCNTCYKSD